ncbi:class I SAM-dependent methyltransferase [soil metagenome]
MDEHRETVRSGYATMGETYHERRVAREEANIAWLDELRPLLPASGRVVDLGCGAGVPVTRYFANRGYEIEGYDLSEKMLAIARREVPQAQFHEAAIEEIRLKPASVDLVVSFFAIIHVERDRHAALFARIFEWLRPGGATLLSLGADDNPAQRSDQWLGAPMVWSHYDATTNLDLLQRAGFEIVWQEVEDFGHERHLFAIARKP